MIVGSTLQTWKSSLAFSQSWVACPMHTLSLVGSSGSRSRFHCHCSPLSFPQAAATLKHVQSGPFSLSCLLSFCCEVLQPLFHLGQCYSCPGLATQRLWYVRTPPSPPPTQNPKWESELISLSGLKHFSHNKNTPNRKPQVLVSHSVDYLLEDTAVFCWLWLSFGCLEDCSLFPLSIHTCSPSFKHTSSSPPLCPPTHVSVYSFPSFKQNHVSHHQPVLRAVDSQFLVPTGLPGRFPSGQSWHKSLLFSLPCGPLFSIITICSFTIPFSHTKK